MKIFIFLILFLPFAAFAQNSPTIFEHNLSWAEIKEKARKEHKYIFIDCFTTWCGPCKYVANNIFPQPKVGAFFNRNFINIKVQFDKTKDDNEEVKKWYNDAANFLKYYSVREYPTFLVFSPDGEMVQKIAGAGEADDFIACVKKALDPETQYAALFKKYSTGNRDPELLKAITNAAGVANEINLINKFSAEYLATQTDLYTKSNLEFIDTYTTNSKSKGFQVLLENRAKVDSVLGEGKTAKIISDIVITEEILPAQRQKNVDFHILGATLKSKYPFLDFSKNIHKAEINYYQLHQDWIKYQSAVSSYLVNYAKELTADELNGFSWSIFEGCSNSHFIAEAVKWSKQSVDKTHGKDATFIDTYANLLHKNGKTKDAIKMEEKALNIVSADEKPAYQATIEKMRKGAKTW